jgi:hypothetical protein
MGYDKIKTTQDLKTYPVEFHILPLCDATSCVSNGRYLNDDGVSVDTTPNVYTLAYAQPVGDAITITVTASDAAAVVDANDAVGALHVYNAASQGLTGSYTVSATTVEDGTMDLGTTTAYDATTDRLIWTAAEGADPVNLPMIASITFTAA